MVTWPVLSVHLLCTYWTLHSAHTRIFFTNWIVQTYVFRNFLVCRRPILILKPSLDSCAISFPTCEAMTKRVWLVKNDGEGGGRGVAKYVGVLLHSFITRSLFKKQDLVLPLWIGLQNAGLGIRSFQKNVPFFPFFFVLYKRTFRSFRSLKRTERSFYILFFEICNDSMTYKTKKNVKRTFQSFIKNGKERKERNVLL